MTSKTKAVIELTEQGKRLRCSGAWTLLGIKTVPVRLSNLVSASQTEVNIDVGEITELDTAGALRLHFLKFSLEKAAKRVTLINLKSKHQLIFNLVEASLVKMPPSLPAPTKENALEKLGHRSVDKWHTTLQFIAFIGEVVFYFWRQIFFHAHKVIQRYGLKVIQEVGCGSLPIVALMNFLVGIVVAYQLGVQLRAYGADVYVVDACGIALLREFSPLITAIILAGRTSTAFAALIGTMKVNEELDALATMGITPVERLVLPRVFGLLISLPLLVVWADFFGILGSMVMAKNQLGIHFIAFIKRFGEVIELKQYLLGMVKTPVFALIIALVGCFQGFQVGTSADSVGGKTTQAAVQSIFLIIIADAVFSIFYSWQEL